MAPLVGLILVILLSVVFSEDRQRSIQSLVRVGEGLIALFVLTLFLRTGRRLSLALVALSLSAGIVGGSAILESQGLSQSNVFFDQLPAGLEKVRARSLMGQPNRTAHYIAITFPLFLFAYGKSRSQIYRVTLGCFAVLAGVGLLVTFSRAGLASLIAGMAVSFWRGRSRVFLLAVVPVMGFIALPLAGLWTVNVGARGDAIIRRMEVFKTGIDSGLQFPLTGIGLGNFNRAHRLTDVEWDTDLLEGKESLNTSAHNLPLCLFVETGIVSLIMLLVFSCQLGWRLLRLSRRAKALKLRVENSMLDSLIACAVAVAVSRMFTTEITLILWWALLSIFVATVRVIGSRIDALVPIRSHLRHDAGGSA
jgi:O-antigen ligase